jgi:tetraacyldisaccharide 4'-kinase
LRGNSHVPIESLRSRKLIAFCGIAAPHRFFALLHHLGIKLAANLSYPDHFSYPSSVLNQIKKLFHEKKADFLCTTEKDAVKLEERPETAGWPLIYLKIKIKPDEEFCHELERIAQSWLK